MGIIFSNQTLYYKMSSTYRIFIGGNRVSTAVALENGSYLQVFPTKQEYSNKASWLFAHVMVREEVTVVDPEGVSTIFKPEVYTLLYDGNFAASSGVRIMKEFYLQWFPCNASFSSRDELLAKNMKEFGVGMELVVVPTSVQTVLPPVTYPEVKKVSAWAKMTDDQRKERLGKMRAGLLASKARRLSRKEAEYWDPNDASLSAPLQNILRFYADNGIRINVVGEGCDCGEC